jgi:hypothetical protein
MTPDVVDGEFTTQPSPQPDGKLPGTPPNSKPSPRGGSGIRQGASDAGAALPPAAAALVTQFVNTVSQLSESTGYRLSRGNLREQERDLRVSRFYTYVRVALISTGIGFFLLVGLILTLNSFQFSSIETMWVEYIGAIVIVVSAGGYASSALRESRTDYYHKIDGIAKSHNDLDSTFTVNLDRGLARTMKALGDFITIETARESDEVRTRLIATIAQNPWGFDPAVVEALSQMVTGPLNRDTSRGER